MSCTTIYLNNVEPYLKQWFIHEQGGEYPVNLVRGSIESNMLFQFLINKKTEEPPIIDERTLAINIPSFRLWQKWLFISVSKIASMCRCGTTYINSATSACKLMTLSMRGWKSTA